MLRAYLDMPFPRFSHSTWKEQVCYDILRSQATNLRGRIFPYQLPAAESGLPKDSVVNVSQIVNLDKQMQELIVGTSNPAKLQMIRDALAPLSIQVKGTH